MSPVERPTRYCRKCLYVLDGLPENRCPECGRPFDPDSPDTYSTSPRASYRQVIARRAADPIVMVPALLALSLMPLIGLLVLPVMLLSAAANVRRGRWAHALAIVALSPFALCFYWGVVDYSRGSVCLRYMGLPGTTFHSIDPVYRCGRATGGDLVNGTEWMQNGPYNMGVRVMVKLLGPMRGSYVGPYPTQAQAEAALGASLPIPLVDLAADRVQAGGRVVNLDPGVGAALFQNTTWGLFNAVKDQDERLELEQELGPISGAVYQGSVLVLRIPTGGPRSGQTGAAPAMLILLDCGTGRPFAYYGQGDYYHRFPPVSWSK
jgi:hypothetical protein